MRHHWKSQLLHALSKSMSITEACVRVIEHSDFLQGNDLIWDESERELLEYLRQRNESVSHLMDSPESISISTWPMVLQAIPNTAVGKFFIFQILNKITGMLPKYKGRDDNEEDPTVPERT